MEKSFFTWAAWEPVDANEGIYEFFNVTLIVDIGSLKKGSNFSSAYMNFKDGIMEFYDGTNAAATFELTLKAKQL